MATITHSVERKRTYGWIERNVFTRAWVDTLPQDLAATFLMSVTLLLRLTMGWIFIWSGFDKLFNDFSAAGFLTNATHGPFGGWFQDLGTNQTALDVINPLVIWGQILIGFTLTFGIFTRGGLFWGAVMMMLFYLPQFPPANNPFMDEHLVYIVVFALLAALGAGRIFGLDALVERLPWVQKNRLVTLLLG
jgi:thiosulfate dehydrogenase [quinone] large subunit